MATLTQAQGSPFSRIYGFGAYRGTTSSRTTILLALLIPPMNGSGNGPALSPGAGRILRNQSLILLFAPPATCWPPRVLIRPTLVRSSCPQSRTSTKHRLRQQSLPRKSGQHLQQRSIFPLRAPGTRTVLHKQMRWYGPEQHGTFWSSAPKMSDFIDPTDRSISFLLGDGAGAVIVGPSDQPGIGKTVWGADGTKANLIYQTHSWQELNANPDLGWPTLRQDGPSVFKWASFTMAPIAKEAIAAAGLTPDDIDVFVPHQANMRIIDQLIKQIKLPDHVVVGRDIADTGNTSAASIPLATHRLLSEGQAKSGDLCLQIGFGAGLAYAAQVIALP